MTNYNERLEEITSDLWVKYGRPGTMDEFVPEAKRAITSLYKEMVAEAKPSRKHVGDEVAENRSYTGERLFNATIDQFEQNLLKELEEL